MSQFPLARLVDFISNVVPFDTLDQSELNELAARMEIAYFPRGKVIIQAGGEPASHLYIIQTGSVKVTIPTGPEDEILVDIRGEGDVFGAVSVLSSRQALFTVQAMEDLLTFLLPAGDFCRLVENRPLFQRYFSYALARNMQALQLTSDTYLGQAPDAHPLKEFTGQMRSRVSELMSKSVLTCRPDVSIRKIAQMMAKRRVSSIIVEEAPGRPAGLITDTDLRVRVLAAGLDPDIPAGTIMSKPPLTISPQSYAFEAMLEMTRHGVHHLLVTESEKLVGVISDHDLVMITGSSPVGLAREIDHAESWWELERYPQRLLLLIEMLQRLGSSAEYMMNLLGEVTDRLTLKLIEINARQMEADGLGGPPIHFCWLAMGESGRLEQAPPASQNCGLAYVDVPSEREAVVKEWFLGLARRVCDGLVKCGHVVNGRGILAKEPRWCQSASTWRQTYLDWVQTADTKSLGACGPLI